MPYTKSNARQEFENKSKNLINLAKAVSYKKVNLLYDHKNLIFQATIILLCSSLEEYLREFVDDLFSKYRAQSATLSSIPLNSRIYSLYLKQKSVLESYIQSHDEADLINKLKGNFTSLFALLDDSTAYTNQVNHKTISNDKKYPSEKNIKILFNRIGIKNMMNEVTTLGRKNYKDQLQSFLDIRQTIAHQQGIALTFSDVERNFNNINDLVSKMDRVLFKHICRTSGMRYW